MMEITEYTALSHTHNGEDTKKRKILKTLGIVGIIGLIFIMVLLSSKFAQNPEKNSPGSSSTTPTTGSSYIVSQSTFNENDYIFKKLITKLCDNPHDDDNNNNNVEREVETEEFELNTMISEECNFRFPEYNNNDKNKNENENSNERIDSSNYDLYIKNLFSSLSTKYHISKIVKPKYNVEWVFGNSIDSLTDKNEYFTIVIQIDSNNDNKIIEMNIFSSKYNDESAESLHHRLFNAFDFNNNGVLCITEFPSMIGAISGFGNIDMSNSIISSFMNDNLNTHIKFNEDEYVNAVLTDNTCNNINNFGDLRNNVQNALIDGYFAITESNNNNNDIDDSRSCIYFDLSWNCDKNSEYYGSYENNPSMLSVSNSLFANVCCNKE